MKTTAIFLAAMMMSALTFGQNNPQFKQAEGQTTVSIYDILRDQLNCPSESPGCFWPGTEVIAFTVTSTGDLIDFRVTSSVSKELDDEMIRVLKETSGKWQPGFIKGEPHTMDHEVALAFIPDHFDPVREAKNCLAKGNRLVSKNPKRALNFYNDAFRLFPCNESILIARSLCKLKLGDIKGADLDCMRIIALMNSDNLSKQFLASE